MRRFERRGCTDARENVAARQPFHTSEREVAPATSVMGGNLVGERDQPEVCLFRSDKGQVTGDKISIQPWSAVFVSLVTRHPSLSLACKH